MRWTHFQALGLALAIMASLLEPASSLSTKLWCPRLNCYSYIVTGVTADILAVDNYAASNNRQRVTFNGTIAFNNLTNQLGTFDMLLVYTWRSGTQGRIFSGAEQAAVASALASGSLKKLMVWWVAFLGGVWGLQPAWLLACVLAVLFTALGDRNTPHCPNLCHTLSTSHNVTCTPTCSLPMLPPTSTLHSTAL